MCGKVLWRSCLVWAPSGSSRLWSWSKPQTISHMGRWLPAIAHESTRGWVIPPSQPGSPPGKRGHRRVPPGPQWRSFCYLPLQGGGFLTRLSIVSLSLSQGLAVTWADLKPVMLPPQPPESLDFRHMPPHLVPRSFRGHSWALLSPVTVHCDSVFLPSWKWGIFEHLLREKKRGYSNASFCSDSLGAVPGKDQG